MIKILRNIILILLLPGTLYYSIVLVGAIIPINTHFQNQGPIVVFLVKNNSHTDLVLPVRNSTMDWNTVIKPEHFQNSISKKYLAFGWGDKMFYQNTPYWKDLKLKVAARAVFINTESAIHVTRVDRPLSDKIIKLRLTSSEYKKLSEYILKHFKPNPLQAEVLALSYSSNDVFYPSHSSFHAFRTCNTWVNSALKYAGIRSCLWTPFSFPIFWQLK